jgi:hypothetical protein
MQPARSSTEYHPPILRRFNALDEDRSLIPRPYPERLSWVLEAGAGGVKKRPELGFKHESQKVEIGIIASTAGVSKRCE